MTETMTAYAINYPNPIGGYQMGDVTFLLERKPSAWHRFWVRALLGWTWRDTPYYGGCTVLSERAHDLSTTFHKGGGEK